MLTSPIHIPCTKTVKNELTHFRFLSFVSKAFQCFELENFNKAKCGAVSQHSTN